MALQNMSAADIAKMDKQFNPQRATQLARFQGGLAGYQAGNATVTGVAMAPTSIYNQAGYYAMQDADTGYVTLQKLGGESLYTQNWYDQGTGTIFDLTEGGQGIVNYRAQKEQEEAEAAKSGKNSSQTNSVNSSSSTSSSSETSNSNLVEYPWGSGYVAVESTNETGETDANDTENVESNGKELSAQDLQDLVDSGIYDNTLEALYASLGEGYEISDEEQAKLGLFSEEDEEKIQMLMDKYDISRTEALEKLDGKISLKAENTEVEIRLNALMESGFSRKEAIDYMEQLGYEVPEDLTKEPLQYSEEDEEKIAALQAGTGCSREEAIATLGCKAEDPNKKGLIRTVASGIGGFFGSIGEGISNAWNSFCDWIW